MMDEMNIQAEPAHAVQNAHMTSLLNTEWLATLSHELRGPLTAIQGYASMLLRHEDRISSEERHEFLQAITKGGDRLAAVLERFLDIANLEAGTIQLHSLPVDLVQLVQDIIVTEQPACPNNTIIFTLQPENDVTLSQDHSAFVIQADSSLLQRMFIQLLDNAQKYSARCTPIEIRLSRLSLKPDLVHIPPHIHAQFQGMDHQFVELSIQDQGIGIPIPDHERIFQRFERVDMRLTREVNGLGLGLTLCKYIVTLHHGAIWVESMPGKGSTFHVLFPTEIQ
jgi:signal transduction histidine kinase